eukprot:PhF_6_TR7887/c0_g1_i5/m.11597/K05643/ABCA3; ATP-binding cassette, subfamily A (ABC1), member 3
MSHHDIEMPLLSRPPPGGAGGMSQPYQVPPYTPPLSGGVGAQPTTSAPPSASGGGGTTTQQFAAAMMKNFRLKRRHWCGTCVEIVIPIVLVVILGSLSRRFPPDPFPAKGFVDANTTKADVTSWRQVLSMSLCVMPGTASLGCVTKVCTNTSNVPFLTLGPSSIAFENKPFFSAVASAAVRTENVTQVLDFESTVALHHAVRQVTNLNRDGGSNPQLSAALPTKLILTPNNAAVKTYIEHLNKTSRYFGDVLHGVMSMSEAESWVSGPEGEGKVWAIINIEEYDVLSRKLMYTIRMNRTRLPRSDLVRERFVNGLGSESFKLYQASGFISLQNFLHTTFFREMGVPPITTPFAGVPMPYDSYKNNVFLSLAGNFLPLVIVLSFLYPVSQLTKRIVEEKELRIREGMLIMGLSRGVFYMSWLTTYFIMQCITSGLITLVLTRTMLSQSSGLVIWLVFVLFGFSVVTMSVALSAVFSKSRLAALLSPFIFAVVCIPMFAIPSDTAPSALIGSSVLSPCAFVLALRTMLQYEMNRGFAFADLASTIDDVNVLTNLVFLAADTVGYMLLALYLDKVLPSEWGTTEHPLFFLMPSYWMGTSGAGSTTEETAIAPSFRQGGLPASPPAEIVYVYPPPPSLTTAAPPNPEAKLHETVSKGDPTVTIQKAKKVFNIDGTEKVAVNELSAVMYPNEITVLLGHNGAGKTTTINMLTGMLPMSGGDCVVYGRSVRTDLAAIRRNMGLCPQHNILWPQLTCWEHLDFYAAIKGLSGAAREQAIQEMLARVGLTPETHKAAGSLSGGQKRKLSVAIAFIGGSQFIILDEPTAGMDVNARHDTWRLLREMTAGRTILLTTHFMDEADVLGQTVSIMTHGRMFCSGSPMFLKSRLGAGYTLSVSILPQCNVAALSSRITSTVPGSHVVSSHQGTQNFLLPSNQLSKFPAALRDLETNMSTLGIQSFGVSNTTLEEVFTKIAEMGADDISQIASFSPRGNAKDKADEDAKAFSWDTAKSTSSSARMVRHMSAILLKRMMYTKRDRRALVFQLLLPVLFVIAALLLGKLGPPLQPRLVLTPTMYNKPSMLFGHSNCMNGFATTLSGLYSTYSPQSLSPLTQSSAGLSDQLLKTYNSHGEAERFLSVECSDPVLDHHVLFHNSTAIHGFPEGFSSMQATMASVLLQKNVIIQAATYPLDWTQRQSAQIQSWQSFITAFFILIPFTFVPATYASWIVKEKESKAKQLQFVCGLNPIAYWVANFLWDLVSFLCTEFLVFIIFLIFQRDEYVGDGTSFVATLILFTLFGMSGISFAYTASHFFTNHSTAQNVVMLTNFVAGFAFVLTVQIMDLLGYSTIEMKYAFRLVPAYCLGEGLIEIAMLSVKQSIGATSASATKLDFGVIGTPVVYMSVMCPLLLSVAIALDNSFVLAARSRLGRLNEDPASGGDNGSGAEDPDVRSERERVEGGKDDDLVRLRGIRKVFNGADGIRKVAVKNLTLGVHRGEIFGFLGTNGAGKTTTISMLCGEFPPTYGSATLCGHDVVGSCEAARQNLGLCPQFDALLDLLTPREHLRLYCALREVAPEQVEGAVNQLLEAAGLNEHADAPSRGLSGGTKRKLSLAIALVGAPAVVFLDEPSAGMDPVARRSMWDTIRRTAVGRCVVLTTHHLEEVEALAHRVGIMVSGELRCIGTLPHLKNKYGHGYELTMKVKDGSPVEAVRRVIEENVSNAERGETHGQNVTYVLPQRTTQLSRVFDLMERQKGSLGIVDYSICQTSLEQVFIRISMTEQQH